MTEKERIIKIEEEFNALLRNLGKEVVWRKEKTGMADSPFSERALVFDKKSSK